MNDYLQLGYIQIGKVGKAVGLKGEFTLADRSALSSNNRLDLPKNSTVIIGVNPNQASACMVMQSRISGDRPVLLVRGVTSREMAEALQGSPVWVKRANLPVDDSREYLWADLIGKKVQDSHGESVGEIIGVNNFGASDIVQMKNDRGQFLELPFVADYFKMDFAATDTVIIMVIAVSDVAELWSAKP